MPSKRRLKMIGFGVCLLAMSARLLRAQGSEVSGKVTMRSVVKGKRSSASPAPDGVVVWLTPLKGGGASAYIGHPGPFRLVQKNKMFFPHLLVIPAGSNVEFPNQDPFFHNVFSLFNGKRFDLGLYESGTSRSVRFDREGVSYIFCNIHPEMGAVVLALSTPYYGISDASGSVTIHKVPPGSYRLNVWSENSQPGDSGKEQIVQVTSEPLHLGEIVLQSTSDVLAHHKNKFGEDYSPEHNPQY